MARSPGFGSMSTNYRAIHTRFPSGSAPKRLNLACKHNSLARSTKSTISPINGLYLLVSTRFQILFTPLPGFFSPFPHGTSSLSVTWSYLGLGGGPPMFPPNFSCSMVLFRDDSFFFRVPDCHRLWCSFPETSARFQNRDSLLACSPFARRYWGNRVFFLFLRVLRCFSSPGLPS